MKPIEALKSARNTYICHQVNRVRLPDFEENRFVRRHITFHGRVQKVGFRIELAQMAERLELTGWVKNLWDGDVEMEVQGDPAAIGRLIQGLESGHFIRIEHMEVEEIPVIRECEFRETWDS